MSQFSNPGDRYHRCGGRLAGASGSEVGLADSPARYLAHAGAGCISAVAGGGKCGQGAVSAVFGKFTTNTISGVGGGGIGGVIARGVATSVAGGVGSVIVGGKFANGAETAAYGYLFNQLAHSGQEALQRGTCTTPSVACSQQNADYRAAYDAKINSQAIEGFYPEKEAALLMMAPVRGAALIDGLIFRTEHYASRLLADGLSVSRVESLVGANVSAMRANMAVNADVGGRLVVDRVTIEYRARLLPNGTVNIGTIFPVK